MPVMVGIVLAAAVAVFARLTGLDRDRAFYPVVTIVVASYYALFAAIASHSTLLFLQALVQATRSHHRNLRGRASCYQEPRVFVSGCFLCLAARSQQLTCCPGGESDSLQH